MGDEGEKGGGRERRSRKEGRRSEGVEESKGKEGLMRCSEASSAVHCIA